MGTDELALFVGIKLRGLAASTPSGAESSGRRVTGPCAQLRLAIAGPMRLQRFFRSNSSSSQQALVFSFVFELDDVLIGLAPSRKRLKGRRRRGS
jgi:hypothetical protein